MFDIYNSNLDELQNSFGGGGIYKHKQEINNVTFVLE